MTLGPAQSLQCSFAKPFEGCVVMEVESGGNPLLLSWFSLS